MTELATAPALDVARVRQDFPILQRAVRDAPLIYLDSAATSLKPVQVLDAVERYYRTSNANVHRGVHSLASEATDLFENARRRVAQFIDAPAEGLVFVRNATEGLNLVASSYARELLSPGDRIVLSVMEHHSNLVPWKLAADRARLELAVLDITDDGRLDLTRLDELLGAPTKLVCLSHQSNVLGTINDIRGITERAHAAGALVCVDAAQSVPHMPVSVRELGSDFVAFSGHKMCAPMGVGVLWARPELLERMPPFLGGGSMIARVTLERTTWNTVPHKFEAGPPDVARLGVPVQHAHRDRRARRRAHRCAARVPLVTRSESGWGETCATAPPELWRLRARLAPPELWRLRARPAPPSATPEMSRCVGLRPPSRSAVRVAVPGT